MYSCFIWLLAEIKIRLFVCFVVSRSKNAPYTYGVCTLLKSVYWQSRSLSSLKSTISQGKRFLNTVCLVNFLHMIEVGGSKSCFIPPEEQVTNHIVIMVT